MIEVSMITMNCASAIRASAAQRRGFADCMTVPFRAADRSSTMKTDDRERPALRVAGPRWRIAGARGALGDSWEQYTHRGYHQKCGCPHSSSTLKSNRMPLSWFSGLGGHRGSHLGWSKLMAVELQRVRAWVAPSAGTSSRRAGRCWRRGRRRRRSGSPAIPAAASLEIATVSRRSRIWRWLIRCIVSRSPRESNSCSLTGRR